MRKTMVYLEERQRVALARYARRRGQPMAAVIREALDRLLVDAERPQKSRLLAVGAGGENTAISERAEEVLETHLRAGRSR
jgi:hypothetical protein